MARKKIVFVIVEGPSDEEALGVLLNQIYDRNVLYVHIMHCDITTDYKVTASNIVRKTCGEIQKYAKNNHYTKKDFAEIIHIVDMDGAYIPDQNIVENKNAVKTIYTPSQIQTSNREKIISRNERKRANLDRLVVCSSMWDIKYRVYYMSCNLDHVLYGKMNSTELEKEQDAYKFAMKYHDQVPAFLKFISGSDFSVSGEYEDSWKYITQECHSLERHTNLGLCFRGLHENT